MPIPNQKGLEELKDNFDYLQGKQEELPVHNIPQKISDHKQTTNASSGKDRSLIDKTQAEKAEADRTESSQQGLDEELTEEELLALTNLADPKLPINEPLYGDVSRELSEVNRERMPPPQKGFLPSTIEPAKELISNIKKAVQNPSEVAIELATKLARTGNKGRVWTSEI